MKIKYEQDRKIIEHFIEGKSQIIIAGELGISRERIRQRLERNGFKGRNYRWIPDREILLSTLAAANSLSKVLQILDLTDMQLNTAIKHYSADDYLKNAKERWRNQKRDELYLQYQRPLINQVRQLALNLGHTPRQKDLKSHGIPHMRLIRVFGSLIEAMLASGLKPNSQRWTSPLPPGFDQIDELTLDFDLAQQRANLLRQLFENLPEPAGSETPKFSSVTIKSYYRDPKVAGWVLQFANGICEVCGTQGYETDAGISFLETHHVVPLGDGGPDTTWNVIAVCETCHGKLHRGKFRSEIQENLYANNNRLRKMIIAE